MSKPTPGIIHIDHLEAYAQMGTFRSSPKIPKSYCSNQLIIQLSLVDVVAGALKMEVSRANEIHHVLK